MSAERTPRQGLDFGRRTRSPDGPRVRVMAGVLSVVTLAAWFVHRHTATAPEAVVAANEVVVEVRGEVPHPGFYTLPVPVHVDAAVAAAGGHLREGGSVEVGAGHRVVVEGERARVEPMDDTLVVGIPVDINRASAAALDALPGIGPTRAQAIVEERETHGPFESVDALTRVRGLGKKSVASLRPFVEVRPRAD